MSTHSQLLLEALDLGLECVDVLRLSLIGCIARVCQLGQTIQCLLQSLNICQQLCDLKPNDTSKSKYSGLFLITYIVATKRRILSLEIKMY